MARVTDISIIIATITIGLSFKPAGAQTDKQLQPMQSTGNVLPGQVESYNGHTITQENSKYGLADKNGKYLIPILYENIYFLDEAFLLLKKDSLWAISDYEHNLLSPFQFLNVDRQNHINFRNFLQFSGLDSSLRTLVECEQRSSLSQNTSSCFLHEIQTRMKSLKRELNSHKLSRYTSRYVLQGPKGYHLLSVYSSGRKYELDSIAWDNVFMVPEIYDYPSETGVQKGKLFGYYDSKLTPEKYLRYEGVYFDYDLYYYESIMFSGTHDSRSPFTVVKKAYVYYYASWSKTNWLKKMTSPPNYPCRYQGKPRWNKYMKEEDFLKMRLSRNTGP